MNSDDIIRMALAGEQPLKDRIKYAIALEREACALEVEKAGMEGYGTLAAAAAIRARSQNGL